MTAAIRLEKVSKRYGRGSPAVNNVSLAVEPGEVFALIGPSGGGKTTTLRLVAGFERPDAGSIVIGDRVVADARSSIPPERRGVGMVFQDYALFPHLNVKDNVGFGLHRSPSTERGQRISSVLALVGLAGHGDRYPHQLSGGQQQRVALARALAPSPALLLLDEPLSNLDADLRTRTRDDLVAILRAAGVTAILVTHDQQEAFVLADRAGVLVDGVLEQVGTPRELYEKPATRFVADFVGEADFLPGEVRQSAILTELGTLPTGAYTDGQKVEVMVRPDDIGLVAEAGGSAVVIGCQYRGEEIAYALRLASGRVVHSHLRESDIQVGDTVRPAFRPRTLVAFPSDPAPGATID